MHNLDEKKMNVIETAGNGVVNQNTVFQFQQKGHVVSARYSGGKVTKGFLVGKIQMKQLRFKYAQQHMDGNVVGGESIGIIEYLPDGKLALIEYFDWDQGKGRNVFREI